ncbi:MAG: amino acid-binding protein [Blautia sp.]|nr:amino acid-binding protein [Blautia sp.]
MLRQNIVFVDNRVGSLNRVTTILKEKGISIYGFACFDSPEFAVFRMVCADPDLADSVMAEKGYMCRITPVIAIDMKDEKGSLDSLLYVLKESNVNLNYIYTSFHRSTMIPVVILYSEDLGVTESILRNNGFKALESLEELEI